MKAQNDNLCYNKQKVTTKKSPTPLKEDDGEQLTKIVLLHN